jgi:hypothetical protein
VKAANVMWFTKIMSFDRSRSEFGLEAATTPILNAEEATKHRKHVIQKIVAAIADHDVVSARRYSDEESRLKHFLEELEGPSMGISPLRPLS